MRLSEIIAQVGDENVKLQNLLDCTSNLRTNKRGVTSITFATDQINATEVATDSTTMLGLVIWLPKDKLPANIKGYQKGPAHD